MHSIITKIRILKQKDNTNGICAFQKPNLPGREAGELPDRSQLDAALTHHPHNRLRPGEGVHRPGDEQTHPVPRAQVADGHGALHEHQHALG